MHSNHRIPSNTLPRNFTFHYTDNDMPSTPQDQIISDPPRQIGPYRLRRRKERQIPSDHYQPSHDIPIPTIEVSESTMILQPAPISRPRGSPPRTPVPHVDETMDNSDIKSKGESISRPSTACSGFSDSSVSSSIESFPSLGGSFTSPECDVVSNGKRPVNQQIPKSTHSLAKHPWTEEMDNHLWMTYMRYLQDPRHTPFKMLPRIAPPLGVCSRVARESKRTWKGPRTRIISRVCLTPSDQPLHTDSPDTVRQIPSGSATPTGIIQKQSWPRSDASTRRRLRELCKKKPTLSAHYNRLLVTRSPSPFASSRNPSQFNPQSDKQDTSFSTRDMSLSLFSSTSLAVSAMNQFTADSSSRIEQTPIPHPSRYGHQKSQSLHLGMGMGSYNRDGLASPFQPLHKHTQPRLLQTPMAPPQLASPLQLAPMQPPRESLKRHLGSDSTDSDPLAPFPDFEPRHGALAGRRVRNRAVSMGDVSASSRRLSLMFEPPSIQIPPTEVVLAPAPYLQPPIGSIRRLGSPFNEKPPRPFNTFPRNFSIHGLAPTLESQEERLGNDLLYRLPGESSD